LTKFKLLGPSFWKSLMKVKDEYFEGGSFTIGNVEETHFWEDI
jgi:hypothetical protein